jgi:protein involved in polysaccharide export with SLBB domain
MTNRAQKSNPFGNVARAARYLSASAAALLMCVLLSGCAAITNPVANGVPVRLLPEELLTPSREGFETIPLTTLRQPPPEKYILEAGDILGIYIEGVLGSTEAAPPVNVPATPDLPPSIGYPIPIRQDGTLSLPYVNPVKVAGMSIEDAEKAVINAYLTKQILRMEDRRILVTLMRPRHIRVMVIRDDSQQRSFNVTSESYFGLGATSTQIGGGRDEQGMVVELPAYENDVLNVLTRTGGLPGPGSTEEIVIQRGYWNGGEVCGDSYRCPTQADLQNTSDTGPRIIHIPIQVRGCAQLPFGPHDVVLKNGDIVTVRSRDPESFFAGGLLPAGEFPLPFDKDITAIEAVLRVRGPFLNGGQSSQNFSGAALQAGVGNPSPSLLSVVRKTPGGKQVVIRVNLNDAIRDPRENILIQDGDLLVLQEQPDEAVARYFSQTVQFNFFGRFLNRTNAQGSVTVVAP